MLNDLACNVSSRDYFRHSSWGAFRPDCHRDTLFLLRRAVSAERECLPRYDPLLEQDVLVTVGSHLFPIRRFTRHSSIALWCHPTQYYIVIDPHFQPL